MANRDLSTDFQGFSKLSKPQRLQKLMEMGLLTEAELSHLTTPEKLGTDLAEKFVENVIGYYQMPLGVAANFRIDGKDYAIPMAVEETSIIAAASKTARWIRDEGCLRTEIIGNTNIGQIQLAKVNDFPQFKATLLQHKDHLIELANEEPAQGLVKRGGGVKDLTIRQLSREDGHQMAVVHVHVDTCDAMGANTIIQICEFLKTPIEHLTQETVTMSILSNLNDSKLTKAYIELPGIDPELGEKIEEAALFAHMDPYRATTHNKGTLNGMDPVLIATGNDWRAVEAAAHAYAARDGQYRSLTRWNFRDGTLYGELVAPITVGVVGGMTRLHPTAQMSLRMLNIATANDLARIVAAVGLVQNLGAIKSLVTFGFIKGHLRLHISNLTLSAGAEAAEVPLLEKHLERILQETNRLTLTHAINALKDIRNNHESTPA